MNDSQTLKNLNSPVLLLGPSHSGKSAATTYFLDSGAPTHLFATAQIGKSITEERLAELQKLRPHWKITQVLRDLSAEISQATVAKTPVVIDSINQWVAAEIVLLGDITLVDLPRSFKVMVAELCYLIQAASCRVIIVSSEVGACPASPNPTERLFRHAIGYTNQKLASAAQSVVTCNAGILQVIKS